MTFRFEAETDAHDRFLAAYIGFSSGAVASTRELRVGVHCDYDERYEPVGFELLEPCAEMDLLPTVPLAKRAEFRRFLRLYVPSWLVFPINASHQVPE